MPKVFSKSNAYLALTCVSLYFFVFGGTNQAFNYGMAAIMALGDKFPVVSESILTAIGLYVLWRISKVVFWFWYRLVVNTIKVTLAFSIVMGPFAVYMRGTDRFFSQDSPLLYDFFWKNRDSIGHNVANWLVSTGINLVNLLSNTDTSLINKWARDNQNNLAYFEKQYGHLKQPAKQFFVDHFDTLKDSLLSHTADEGFNLGSLYSFFAKRSR